jgi:hypothetical protein
LRGAQRPGAERGWWQAQVAEANGGTIIISYTLRVLLDELDDLLGGQAAASTPS